MKYHKIQTVFKRDPSTKFKTLLTGDYSLPEFKYLEDNEWAFTEKVDGTNIRVYSKRGKVSYGGRTDNAQIPASLISRLNELFLGNTERLEAKFGDSDVCLYGEGYGGKIQKAGKNYRQDPDFVLFDVMVGQWWLQREDVEDVAKALGIDVVPVIFIGTLREMVNMAKSGFISRWGDFNAEGIVARPVVELKTRGGDRIITKIKCRDFPLEKD